MNRKREVQRGRVEGEKLKGKGALKRKDEVRGGRRRKVEEGERGDGDGKKGKGGEGGRGRKTAEGG